MSALTPRWVLSLISAFLSVTTNAQEYPSFEFGSVVGMTWSNVSLKGHNGEMSDVQFETGATPFVGVFANMGLTKRHRKITLYNELLYTYFQGESTGWRRNPERTFVYVNTSLRQRYLKLNSMLSWRISVDPCKIMINTGVATGVLIDEKVIEERETSYHEFRGHTTAKGSYETRKIDIGLLFGAGVLYKKFSFESRYELASGIFAGENTHTSVNRFSLLAGYRISR